MIPNKIALDSKSAGLRNEKLVLELIQQNGSLSQAQICKMAGLRSSTASYIVGRLRDKGLIVEKTGQSSKRGAKPVILSINPQGKFVIGAAIHPSHIHLGLFDFQCGLVENIKAPIGTDGSPEAVVDALEINLRGLLGKHRISDKEVLGAGVTLSGSISKEGMVVLSSPLKWKNVKLLEMLQRRLDFPVSIHTTRVRLLAEKSMKESGQSQNIVYLNIAGGVGISVIIDGHLLHGATNRCGEWGHMVVDPDGPLCGCGHKGCLEAHISGPALAHKIEQEITTGNSILKQWIGPKDLPEAIIQKWGRAIQAGDSYALAVQQYVCDHAGRAAALAINLYDPDLLILAGYVSEACLEALQNAIRQRIHREVFDDQSRHIEMIAAQAGELALVRGVAMTILQDIMKT